MVVVEEVDDEVKVGTTTEVNENELTIGMDGFKIVSDATTKNVMRNPRKLLAIIRTTT